MRNEFSRKAQDVLVSNPKTVFITGDLGFNALEGVQSAAKTRFINAGVAEQNMMGVAAGLAYKGYETFVYSIAPFAVYRCFEQIKIDVCIHNMPVYIIGNGGGYGYGIMGATHHAIEDIGCLSTLPNITCWIPAFNEDVEYCMNRITELRKPAYLRLGMGKNYPADFEIAAVNHIKKATRPKITIVALGPVVHNALDAAGENDDVDVFTVLTVPFIEISEQLIQSIKQTKRVLVIEEHVARGGLGEYLLSWIIIQGIAVDKYKSLHAKGYPNKLYGSQAFHQKESGLDVVNIKKQIAELVL